MKSPNQEFDFNSIKHMALIAFCNLFRYICIYIYIYYCSKKIVTEIFDIKKKFYIFDPHEKKILISEENKIYWKIGTQKIGAQNFEKKKFYILHLKK